MKDSKSIIKAAVDYLKYDQAAHFGDYQRLPPKVHIIITDLIANNRCLQNKLIKLTQQLADTTFKHEHRPEGKA